MKTISRRDLLKSSLLAPAAVSTAQGINPIHSAGNVIGELSGPLTAPATLASPTPGAGRERLLLDFGWRFHLGHASDPSKDFGYGALAEELTFAKSGGMPEVTRAKFD